ncbi:MAG: leucine-rich repeat protein [Ruminococcus sp.]|nr:leucine-rich repeat protein [Ruminococcus sp.]
MEEKKFSAVHCPKCKAEILADKTVAKWYCGYCGASFPLSEEKQEKPVKIPARGVRVVAVKSAKNRNAVRDAQPVPAPKKEEVKAPQPAPAPKKEEVKAPQPAPAPKKEEAKAPQPAPAPKKEEAKAPQPAPAPKKEEVKAPQPAPALKKEEAKAPQPAPAPKKEEAKAPQPAPAPKKEEVKAEEPKAEEKPAEKPAPKPEKKSSDKEFEILHGVLEKYNGSAEEVVIPEDVECIAPSAFKDNTTIKSVVIPDGVYDIGALAFDGCTALESVKLPLQISKIGYKAFNGCESLTSITIPRGVKEVANNALICGLREITFENSKTTWEPENEFAMPSFEVDRKGTGEGVRTIYFNNISFPASDIYKFKSVAAFLRTQGLCVYCGGKFGMFSKCKNCGRKKDY